MSFYQQVCLYIMLCTRQFVNKHAIVLAVMHLNLFYANINFDIYTNNNYIFKLNNIKLKYYGNMLS